MKNLIEVQKKIIPQAIDLMEKRYAILRQINISQPIGRRMLSSVLNLSERTTRTEIDFLKEQKFINIDVSGMTITSLGKELLDSLELVMGEIMGISDMQTKLKDLLGIKDVVIAKRVGDDNIKSVAKSAAEYIIKNIEDKDIIAVAGGTTMREIAENIESVKSFDKVRMLPTRGSVGGDIDLQANSIAAMMAKKLGSQVEFLYIPDTLDGSAREAILSVPDIKHTLDYLKDADKIFFSIGRADVMALRRGMSADDLDLLKRKKAVGEAFGYYFDKDGNIVLKLNTVGIDIDMYKRAKDASLVFSGKEKVEAFLAMYNLNRNLNLITDEECAKELISRLS
nr:sugar-binding domain-containing protein [uncultured Peptostreptococcus sp.]